MRYGSPKPDRMSRSCEREALHRFWLTLAIFSVVFTLFAPTSAAAGTGRVYGLQVHGVISQLTADHVLRVVGEAERERAPLVIELNSPGGVESAIRRIAQAMIGARVPILVYVGPGTEPQALSGALLIVLAANVAAANLDAKIGAALPVGLTDRADQDEQAARVARALQSATSIAEARGRNTKSISEVVQQERVLSAKEALSNGVIDRISPDVATLLGQIDGTVARTAAGNIQLATRDAHVDWISMTWREQFLHAITDPNIAYLLFSSGVLLLIIALFAPARLLAGIPGVLALIVAFIAFGNLPVSRLGVGLLILGGLLFIAEQFSPRVGIPGTLGVISYLIGSFTLYQPVRQTSPFAPVVRVNPWLVVGTVSFFVIALLLILRAIVRLRRSELEAAAAALVGCEGVVIKALEPHGEVLVHDEEWLAIAAQAPIDEGQRVVVRRADGAVLVVEPLPKDLVRGERRDPAPSEAGGSR